AVWCGISFAGILYFALFKGLNNSGLIPGTLITYVNDHVWLTLLVLWAASSLVLLGLQALRFNIIRTTILAGTFALALAFAGNDLVNFIGVPLAGLDSYNLARESGNEAMLMGQLMEPARANFFV
ncbi:MAG: inorganic phosphate transporter, partial [Alistipes sp.]